MKVTGLYLFATIASIFVCLCDGAQIRVKRWDSEVESNLDSNGRCKTAKTWRSDCNQCWCDVDNVPACTLKGCIQLPNFEIKEVVLKNEEEKKDVTEKRETTSDGKCTPGTNWMEDCNSCFCTDDGLSACTEKGCISLVEKEKE